MLASEPTGSVASARTQSSIRDGGERGAREGHPPFLNDVAEPAGFFRLSI